MEDKVLYWIDLADYDMDTAHGMLKVEKFLYVGFMCHQVIEKALKAIIAQDCDKEEIPPKTHDLTKLAIRAKVLETMPDAYKDFLEDLNPLNIEARYPKYNQHLLNTLTKDRCHEIIVETEQLLCWIKKQL